MSALCSLYGTAPMNLACVPHGAIVRRGEENRRHVSSKGMQGNGRRVSTTCNHHFSRLLRNCIIYVLVILNSDLYILTFLVILIVLLILISVVNMHDPATSSPNLLISLIMLK